MIRNGLKARLSGQSRPWIFALSAIVLVILSLRFFQHTVDDAFIGYRYAWNWVQGHGLVFNPGERVEGYTNFLWVVLAAAVLRIGGDPEVGGRLLGLVATIATLAAVVRWSPRPMGLPALVWLAPLAYAVSPPNTVWATGGMETPLFTCLLTWGVCLSLDAASRRRISPLGSVCIGLASLTRPEGILFAILVPAVGFWVERRKEEPAHGWVKDWLVWGAIFLAVFTPYYLWRLLFYGYPFPNTFYAKVDPAGSQLPRGLMYFKEFLAIGYGIPLLAGLIAWLPPRREIATALPVIVLFYVAYVIYIGGDGLPMFRFFVPVLGLGLLAASGGIARLKAPRTERWIERGGWLIVGLCIVGWLAIHNVRGPAYRYVEQDRYEVSCWKEIGRWLRIHAREGSTIAVVPAGAIPYFSQRNALDMLGLNDVAIAHADIPHRGRSQAGHEKYDVDYVLRRKPEYIMIGVYRLVPRPLDPVEMVRPSYPVELRLLERPELWDMYRLRSARVDGGYFAYFERKI